MSKLTQTCRIGYSVRGSWSRAVSVYIGLMKTVCRTIAWVTLKSFTSNAFSKDQVGVGGEFSFMNQVVLRAAYKLDLGESDIETNSIYTGFAGGATIEVPMNKSKGNNLGIDYAYRATNPFKGTHNFTLRFSL